MLGVLVIEGMGLIDAVRVVERHGGHVHQARLAESGCLLDVSLSPAMANSIAVALMGVPTRFFDTAEVARIAS